MTGKPPAWRFMMNYKRGDVVLVRFPMPDLSLYKPRPALIIQNDKNNKGGLKTLRTLRLCEKF